MDNNKIYLDNAATTPLTPSLKRYIVSLFNLYQNPSSIYHDGIEVRKIIDEARSNVAKFINAKSENILFTSSGSAANTLVIKGLTSENPMINNTRVFYSPTAHKSMIKACESCIDAVPLKVNILGEIDLSELRNLLQTYKGGQPLVCVEFANSEVGTINDIKSISTIVRKYNGLLFVDATGYIPSYKVDVEVLKDVDYLTFSGHKLHSLKGTGVLYRKNINRELNPLIYGSQEEGVFGGTENVFGIACLGYAVKEYDYSSINSENRDYILNRLITEISDCYLIGSVDNRLPHNLYMCFKGITGEALMILLDENNIQVSTGSACNSGNFSPSATLVAMGIPDEDIHNCIRITLSGEETHEQLDYVCDKIKEIVNILKMVND